MRPPKIVGKVELESEKKKSSSAQSSTEEKPERHVVLPDQKEK